MGETPVSLLRDVSSQRPESKYFRRCCICSLCHNYSTLSLWSGSSHRRCESKSVWLCSNGMLGEPLKFEFHIFSCAMKLSSLFIPLPHLKKCKKKVFFIHTLLKNRLDLVHSL